jgi:hypothetical protein
MSDVQKRKPPTLPGFLLRGGRAKGAEFCHVLYACEAAVVGPSVLREENSELVRRHTVIGSILSMLWTVLGLIRSLY